MGSRGGGEGDYTVTTLHAKKGIVDKRFLSKEKNKAKLVLVRAVASLTVDQIQGVASFLLDEAGPQLERLYPHL